MLQPETRRVPQWLLCDEHRDNTHLIYKWPLYRQIDEIRRTMCECNVDMLYTWYDLIGFLLDEIE